MFWFNFAPVNVLGYRVLSDILSLCFPLDVLQCNLIVCTLHSAYTDPFVCSSSLLLSLRLVTVPAVTYTPFFTILEVRITVME